jgi:hypothetical protein
MEEIVNKIANSSLITLDLEELLQHPSGVKVIDIKDYLFQGLILKEKDFRQMLKDQDWSEYHNNIVAIENPDEAIIPTWAYMLFSTYLKENCLYADVCDKSEVLERYYLKQVYQLDLKPFDGKRVVLKGCGKLDIPQSTYSQLTERLNENVKSIMFGEPCSTVPVFKKK